MGAALLDSIGRDDGLFRVALKLACAIGGSGVCLTASNGAGLQRANCFTRQTTRQAENDPLHSCQRANVATTATSSSQPRSVSLARSSNILPLSDKAVEVLDAIRAITEAGKVFSIARTIAH